MIDYSNLCVFNDKSWLASVCVWLGREKGEEVECQTSAEQTKRRGENFTIFALASDVQLTGGKRLLMDADNGFSGSENKINIRLPQIKFPYWKEKATNTAKAIASGVKWSSGVLNATNLLELSSLYYKSVENFFPISAVLSCAAECLLALAYMHFDSAAISALCLLCKLGLFTAVFLVIACMAERDGKTIIVADLTVSALNILISMLTFPCVVALFAHSKMHNYRDASSTLSLQWCFSVVSFCLNILRLKEYVHSGPLRFFFFDTIIKILSLCNSAIFVGDLYAWKLQGRNVCTLNMLFCLSHFICRAFYQVCTGETIRTIVEKKIDDEKNKTSEQNYTLLKEVVC